MPAALIQPAVPPPTMTTRNGGDRLSSRMASPIDPPGTPSRVMILDAGSRAALWSGVAPSEQGSLFRARLPLHPKHSFIQRISELEADTELVAPINPRPARIPENRLGSWGCCGIAKYLLLVHGPGIQQVGRVERQLDMGADRVANRTVEEPRILLEHRQTDAAIQVGRFVTGAPVVSKADSDRSLLIESDEIEGMGGNPL